MVKSFLKNIINIVLSILLKILLKMDIIHVNYILNEGYVTTYIERYICKNCGKNYQVDMFDVVVENNNITNEIKNVIWKYYAISKISLRKTHLILKSIHNINISY